MGFSFSAQSQETWVSLAQDYIQYNPQLAQLKAQERESRYKFYQTQFQMLPTLDYKFMSTYQNIPKHLEDIDVGSQDFSFENLSDIFFPKNNLPMS